jgi:hypothetical protein
VAIRRCVLTRPPAGSAETKREECRDALGRQLDWAWMTFTMSFWVIALGVVVYLAVRLAQSERGKKTDL